MSDTATAAQPTQAQPPPPSSASGGAPLGFDGTMQLLRGLATGDIKQGDIATFTPSAPQSSPPPSNAPAATIDISPGRGSTYDPNAAPGAFGSETAFPTDGQSAPKGPFGGVGSPGAPPPPSPQLQSGQAAPAPDQPQQPAAPASPSASGSPGSAPGPMGFDGLTALLKGLNTGDIKPSDLTAPPAGTPPLPSPPSSGSAAPYGAPPSAAPAPVDRGVLGNFGHGLLAGTERSVAGILGMPGDLGTPFLPGSRTIEGGMQNYLPFLPNPEAVSPRGGRRLRQRRRTAHPRNSCIAGDKRHGISRACADGATPGQLYAEICSARSRQ